jgi:organic radical activating enzyme
MTPFDKDNINKDTFCLLPMMSLYMGPAQEVMPCCVGNWQSPMGKATSKESLIQIYNNDKFRQLRHDLVNGIKNPTCDHCWKFEELHATDRSLRKVTANKYKHLEQEVISRINPDYSLNKIEFNYLDIRFSNICNLKCRSCGGHFSSLWNADEEKLGWDKWQPERKKIMISVGDTDMMDLILEQLPNVKEIYFAGGEPLVQDEHYMVLDRILELGLQHKIEIRYNTNFAKLTHKGKKVTDYWQKFSKVVIGASLDGSHERGEYIRKGLDWATVIQNRKDVMAECPHVNFHISLTLSIMNAYNIVDFHREWVELGLIKPNEFMINLLFGPDCYRISNLPDHHKEKVIKLYEDQMAWLTARFNSGKDIKSDWIVDGYQGAIELIKQDRQPTWVNDWNWRNGAVDRIRDEDFFTVFPEFSDLKDLLNQP